MSVLKPVAVTAWMLAFATAACAEPKQLWELAGLKTPESVVVDTDAATAYVSNIDGEVNAKDTSGSISQVSLDGKMINADWVSGLNAPKGLALHKGKLYAADVDQLVEIDVVSAKIVARHAAEGAVFLNDVAASPEGDVYVTDTVTNTIWRLANGKLEAWLKDEKLLCPNGITVQDGKLIVAAWGKIDGEGFATSVPGHLLEVSLADKSVRSLGNGEVVGNLDGIEPLDGSSYLVTDFMAGALLQIDTAGKAKKLAKLPSGSADLAFVPARRLVLIPLLKDNKLLAFELD